MKIAPSLSDPAMVQYARQGLEELLDDGVDLLFCNEQEALMFTNTENLDDAIAALKLKIHISSSRKAQMVQSLLIQQKQFHGRSSKGG